MSLFKNIFQSNSSENEGSKLNWIPLTQIDQLNEIETISTKKPVLIFKHSTRCGISRFALKNFEKSFDIEPEILDCYFLDLLSYRNISSEVAEKFSVQHQSPQAILIVNETVVYHDSHSSISVNKIKEFI